MTSCHKTRDFLFDHPTAGAWNAANTANAWLAPAETADAASRATCTLGRCLRSRDPLGTGRVLVAYQDGMGEECHLWLAPLVGLHIEVDDELLLLEPRGDREPIIAGIVARAVQHPMAAENQIALSEDASLTITAHNGAKLVEISQEENGPVVRLCQSDVQLELPGKLRIDASEIELRAAHGPVQIQAQEDVVVRGETIRLN